MTRRQETIPRAQGIENGLAARVHDPLWFLARQWQFGEFRAEDAASPAFVDLDNEVHHLDRWRPAGTVDWQAYDPATEPLERLVEEEPRAFATPALRLDGGLRLRRLLDDAGQRALFATFVEKCGFPDSTRPVPPTAATLATAVRRRLPDGARLAGPLARLADPELAGEEAVALGLPAGAAGSLAAVATAWSAWWTARAPAEGDAGSGGPPAAWDENRLEYGFDVGSSTLAGTRLNAAAYPGGRLDWWAVDAAPEGVSGEVGQEPTIVKVRSVPAPARFGGMPSPRFWEMEDARFDPGAIDASAADLGRLLLTTFATVYGNDWFVVPVSLPIATLSRVTRFGVTDVFGRTFELAPAGAADDGWNLFGTTDIAQPRAAEGERMTSPWFLLAPGLPDALESAPVETVLLLRDEMANLAWAVEASVTDDGGALLDRFGTSTTPASAAGLAPGAIGRYRVDSVVPDHWYPLVAEPLEDRESVLLRLVPLARQIDGVATTVLPIGALLAASRAGAGPGAWFHEEEVPRAGITVVRTNQHARWHDGSVHNWTGRRKATGGGEGSSGVRFDTVEPG